MVEITFFQLFLLLFLLGISILLFICIAVFIMNRLYNLWGVILVLALGALTITSYIWLLGGI